MIGISACLAGIACRYDGRSQEHEKLANLVRQGQAVVFCPEVEGGLKTPRNPAEIIDGDGFDVWHKTARVIESNGQDVTESYQKGAKIACQRLKELGITTLILKEKSPSCGSLTIYDGSFSGKRINGVGVATAYFIQQGIKVLPIPNGMKSKGN